MEDRLEEQLVAAVREWFLRMTQEHDTQGREIKIRLSDRQGDEDGILYLEATIEETGLTELGGRVPGVKF